ncbi:DUF58 domain-containing protein [Glaciecola sp. 1036]|uniref:DUF58 domain-containing protein n=1 Tax=Alteromonadaceae TaxID=72275 RepID=UPI003D06EEB2
MLAQNEIQDYLNELESNGIQLQLPELLRYKALSSILKLSPNKGSQHNRSGMDRSTFKGRGMEFDEARFYQPGDDIRSIDWRVTARTGKPHTKIFREERERPVFVFVDLSDSMQFGTQLLLKSVQAAHLASLLGFAAVARGDKFGGVIFNQTKDIESKPKAQNKSVLSVIDQMIGLQQLTLTEGKSQSASLNALQRLNYIAKPGSLVHLISDFSDFTDTHFNILGNLSRHCELMANYVYDPLEIALPEIKSKQALMVTDGENKQSIMLGDKDKNQMYRNTQSRKVSLLHNRFSSIKTPIRKISAGQPLSSQLSMGNRGFVIGETL